MDLRRAGGAGGAPGRRVGRVRAAARGPRRGAGRDAAGVGRDLRRARAARRRGRDAERAPAPGRARALHRDGVAPRAGHVRAARRGGRRHPGPVPEREGLVLHRHRAQRRRSEHRYGRRVHAVPGPAGDRRAGPGARGRARRPAQRALHVRHDRPPQGRDDHPAGRGDPRVAAGAVVRAHPGRRVHRLAAAVPLRGRRVTLRHAAHRRPVRGAAAARPGPDPRPRRARPSQLDAAVARV